ncbi:Intein C-terminal splicing region [uncultured Caudovirales phage]|uniref:Intein C-terminal splicing region n=1 Tax=uncultured Caudovirales phage TaxID=2100421 RepID=A0A6J5MKC2_9CAUD|nr:Intein C-terminal splicing region [uncultured Caudovirales phage]CAB4176913.1 Intein C-terminal splicing region [uncultured Caudovirales phage]CAB4189834.1 Intein C-terminal splicing region [uncultured Caudovirales phage]
MVELDIEAIRAGLMGKPLDERCRLAWRLKWELNRLPHQIAPLGDWTIWLMLAGRGAGKTRSSAETLGGWAVDNPNTRWLVSAPTYSDLVHTCFEGESGLLNVIPRHFIVQTNSGSLWNKSDTELKLTNGSIIKGVSAENPERFRGGNYHGGWLDEYAAWMYARESFDNLILSLRLGDHPKLVISTTPKPKAEIRTLLKREGKDVVVTRASTYDNLKNLAPTFREQILQYEGTQIGRQEIHAEVLDPEEHGIIRRSWFKLWPAGKELPQFHFIVMSLDTAFTEKTRDKKTGDRDPTACTVWGLFRENGKEGILLLDCWEAMLGMPELIERVPKEMKQHYGKQDKPLIKSMFGPSLLAQQQGRKPDVLIIEDKGSGISLRQMLSREGIHAYAYNPGRAKKVERLHAVSHLFANGLIWVVESENKPGHPRTWAEPMIAQICAFSGEGTTDHDDFVDSCLVGETFVLMADGTEKRIDEVVAGDFVQTPEGPCRVTVSCTTGIKPIWRIEFNDSHLEGSFNHPIYVDGEWKPLALLRPFDTLSTPQTNTRSSPWRSLKKMMSALSQFISTATNTTDTRTARTSPINDTLHDQSTGYIGTFGSSITGQFQSDTMSTTKMETRSTTTSRILSASMPTSITKAIKAHAQSLTNLRGRLLIWRPFATRLRRGTLPPRDLLGIPNTPSIQFAPPEQQSPSVNVAMTEHANGAAGHSYHKAPAKSFARLLAKLKNPGSVVVSKSRSTHTMRRVYNLTVERAECFYANGILTHNCSQALRLIADRNLVTVREPEPQTETTRAPQPPKPNPYAA